MSIRRAISGMEEAMSCFVDIVAVFVVAGWESFEDRKIEVFGNES